MSNRSLTDDPLIVARLVEALEKLSTMPLKATRIKEYREIANQALADYRRERGSDGEK